MHRILILLCFNSSRFTPAHQGYLIDNVAIIFQVLYIKTWLIMSIMISKVSYIDVPNIME